MPNVVIDRNKLRYLLSSASKLLDGRGRACPSCGGSPAATLDRKWIVTSLRRCADCRLLYRTPTTTTDENAAFYQTDYREGATTDLPSDADLAALMGGKYAGHGRNYSEYIEVLRALGVRHDAKVFDFGCSWGYGSYQLAQEGFEVDAFEISRPRAEYARSRLGVRVRPVANASPASYDVFLCAHVIEHVPSVSGLIETGMRCLKPGGLFIAFTPNGSAAFRAVDSRSWHARWGLVHPQVIDDVYLLHRFAGMPLIVTSTPHPTSAIARWDRSADPLIAGVEGAELLFAVQQSGGDPPESAASRNAAYREP